MVAQLFSAIVIVAVVTTLVTPFALKRIFTARGAIASSTRPRAAPGAGLCQKTTRTRNSKTPTTSWSGFFDGSKMIWYPGVTWIFGVS